VNTIVIWLVIDVAKFMEIIMEPDQIGIIFCTSKADTVHKRFTHCSSHSDIPNQAHNEAEWCEGHKRWIAAMTDLIHGIDAPNVGVAIFVRLPYG
jgi:hypothetical protein